MNEKSMNENTDDFKGPLVIAVIAIVGYFLYQLLTKIVAAIASFLFGLVTIGLFAVGILVAYFLLRYIVEKQYGDDLRMRKVQKLEEQRLRSLSQASPDMHEPINQFFQQRKENVYRVKTEAKFDTAADRLKQFFNIFRRDK